MTLRQLLNLDKLPDVPDTWPGQTYDFFWIVEFGTAVARADELPHVSSSNSPRRSNKVPSNEWGKRAKLPMGSKCLP